MLSKTITIIIVVFKTIISNYLTKQTIKFLKLVNFNYQPIFQKIQFNFQSSSTSQYTGIQEKDFSSCNFQIWLFKVKTEFNCE